MVSYIAIIASLAVWSSWGIVVRGLDMPVHLIAFYNALFGLFFQGVALAYIGRRSDLQMTRELGAVVLLGICGISNLVLFFYALKATTVAGALITHYTAPVFVALIAPFVLKDRTGRVTLYALTGSVIGLALIFLAGGGVQGKDGLLGLAAGTASGLAYALVIIISRGISGRHHPVKLVFVQGVIAVVALGLWTAPSGITAISTGQAALFALLGLAHSTMAVAVYLYGIRGVSAQEAGVLGYLEPVLGIILAFIFLGEAPQMLAIAGGVLILVSGTMVVVAGTPRYAGGTDDNRG